MRHDDWGRRVFRTEDKAFKAQQRSAVMYGVFPGVVCYSDDYYVLTFDPLAHLYQE